MRSTTTTIETSPHVDRLVDGFVAAAGDVLAFSEGELTGAAGAGAAAAGVLTVSVGVAAAVGVADDFRGRADGLVG